MALDGVLSNGQNGVPNEKPQLQLQPIPGYATSPNPAHGEENASSRLLHIYRDGSMTHRKFRIVDSDKETLLYTFKIAGGGWYGKAPQIRIQSAATNAETGTVSFREPSLLHIDHPYP